MLTDWAVPVAMGFAAGILSAWGVGGGTLLLLGMQYLLGADGETARAVNLLFFLPTAAAALFFHRKNGYLRKDLCLRALAAGIPAALAASATAAVLNAEALRRPFGLFLLWAGLTTARGALSRGTGRS